MNYSYKLLAASDVALLKQLLKVFGEAFGDVPTYQSAIPNDAYLKSLLSKPHFIVLVAMNDQEIVGGLAAYELEKFEQDRREIYIYDLAVAQPHRRHGIATKLIKELRALARQRKACVIFVQADPGDLPAIRLYESLGTKEDVHHFHIPVDGLTK